MKPGFHHDVTSASYHADPCPAPSLSASMAKTLLSESPCKAWYSHPRMNPNYRPDAEPKFDLGTAAHAMLLEEDATSLVIVQADDWRTKAAKGQREQANASGKTAILERHFADVNRMVISANKFIKDSEIAEYWQEATSEVTVIWQEKGLWLRSRFDRFSNNQRCIMDYKSTDSAAPEVFQRQIPRMGYHIQEAFYRRGVRAQGLADPHFVFLAQSVEQPHECTLHGCDPAMREIADAEVERAIGIWRTCMSNGKWPSYDGRIHWATPTTYMLQDHEMRLLEAA